MEAIKSVKYHPVPAVRSSKVKQTTNGMQKLYTKIINKIEDLPPKLHTKIQQKPAACNLVRGSPVSRPVAKVKKPTSPVMKKPQNMNDSSTMILSDDDDFYSKLTFDDSEQSLEDEIFEELEKVAHDEVKLNAALQNFDRILLEYNDKKTKELKATEAMKKDEKPSAIPKPLQKSKTCSIIESKCILKKQQQNEKKKNLSTKVEKPLKVENFEPIASANYYQVTKSLWNLQDFDEFAKSASPKTQLGPRKSEGSMMVPRAKSVWDMTPAATPPRPTYSRQSSISKIPIKLSKLSTSMMQLNASFNSSCSPSSSSKLSKSSVFASTMSLTSPQPTSKLSSTRRSTAGLTSKKIESSSSPKYAETKASLQRRNMLSSTNSINRLSISIAPSKSLATVPLKSAKSEMSIHGRFAMKAFERQQQQSKQQQQKVGTIDPVHQNRMTTKAKRDGDSLLDKCLVKGQELLRKAEEFNDSDHHDKAKIVSDARKRDYIAKQQPKATSSTTVLMNTNSSLENVNSIKNHHKDANETLLLKVNAITNHSTVDNQTGNHQQQRQIESEMTSKPVSQSTTTRTTVTTTKIISLATQPIIGELLQSPTLESCEIIPVVLDAPQLTTSIVDATKDYSSDCSDDSGHISNENEDLTLKMDVKKPRKISEELLEIFEKKTQQKVSPTKAKVIELNHVNLIKTSMEIYPSPNKTCKSEVTFFINKY
jgi:hypothetical protein